MTKTKLTDYLLRQAKSSTISSVDAALILLALNAAPNSSALIEKVKGSAWDWISSDELSQVIMRCQALYSYDPKIIDGTCLALLAKRLMTDEKKVGGPYKAQDMIFTNAIIAQLFRSFKSPLLNVELYLKTIVAHDDSSTLSLIHTWALAWPYVIVDMAAPDDETELNISVAAMTLCLMAHTDNKTKQSPVSQSKNPIITQIREELTDIPEPARSTGLMVCASVARADKRREITMLASFFQESLVSPAKDSVASIAHDLGVANFYTWMAYTLYDDFIDEEGQPRYVPVANIAHRRAVAAYLNVASTPVLQRLVNNTFDAMDVANAWEVTNCRFVVKGPNITIGTIPRFANGSFLARRAGAHILGPLLLMHSNHSTLIERQAVKKSLMDYLIARQLNDDIHDWQEDLRRGQVSFVVAFLLRAAHVIPGTYPIDILITRLEVFFWRTGLQEVTDIIIKHIDGARSELIKYNLIVSDSVFMRHIVDPIKASAEQSLQIHQDQKRFLKHYSEK